MSVGKDMESRVSTDVRELCGDDPQPGANGRERERAKPRESMGLVAGGYGWWTA